MPAGFAVAVLLASDATELIVIAPDGTLAAGPAQLPGSREGLFVTADGRLGALGYRGELTLLNAADLTPRPGESAALSDGTGLGTPVQLAWRPATGTFITRTREGRLASATPDFAITADLGIDLSGYALVGGLDLRADTDELVLADRAQKLDPATGARTPRVDFYSLSTLALGSSVHLAGLPAHARLTSLAYAGAAQRVATTYRRAGGAADPIDSRVYLHALDGSVIATFDLRPFGFSRVSSVHHLPTTDELLCVARDLAGTLRLVVTSPTGQPRRAYRTDALVAVDDVAAITSGAHTGELGVVSAEPSRFTRATLE